LTVSLDHATLGTSRIMARARSKATTKGDGDDDVRASVLAAAVKLIDKGGLASLSMREVARTAGVSHQAPYHYFADREAILAALADEGFKILSTRLENARDPEGTSGENFSALGQAYVHFALDHPSLFRIMFRPDFVDHERFPELTTSGERAFANLPKIVEECISEGFPATPSAEAHVILNWSLVHGLACLILDGPLAIKVPATASKQRDAIIDDVMQAMRGLIEARMPPKKPRRR
jgi:AcrR family transcriptional regulator